MPSTFPPRSKHLHVLMVFLLLSICTQAQDQIIRVTEALKPNVVAIQTTFADGSSENGFGFITGEKNGQLYLVTAGHVLHGREAQTPKKIQVRFFSTLRSYPAEEENWFEADDLSLLTLPKPATVQWKPAFAHYNPQNYQTVRFVGKNQDWISPGTGEIFRLSKDRIEFTMYSLEPGSSGAPLIGDKGIIGLILQDERASSVALHLARIRELIGDARFPYFSAELYDAAVVSVPSSESANQGEKLPENMVFVKGGNFTMGCTSEQGSDCYDSEKPAHQVNLRDFYLSKYEVTVQEFEAFIDASNYRTDADKEGNSYIWSWDRWEPKNGVNWRCDVAGNLRPNNDYNHPVIHVSWNDAVAYCNWLAQTTGKKYRLPTEAEWEYAARGGNQSQKFKYAGSNNFDDVAWHTNNSGNETHAVGLKRANELGLYDLSGNVQEWCQDWYGDYSSSTQTNPTGAGSGSYRVYRGSSWNDGGRTCRVSYRYRLSPTFRNRYVGFRLAL